MVTDEDLSDLVQDDTTRQTLRDMAIELQAWREFGKHYGLMIGGICGTLSVVDAGTVTDKPPDPA